MKGSTQDLYLLQPTYFPNIFWAWYVGKLLLWKGRYMIIHTHWLKRMNWPSIQILPLFLFPDLYLMSDIRAGFRPISSTYSEHISTKSKQSRFLSPHFPHFEPPKEICHMILVLFLDQNYPIWRKEEEETKTNFGVTLKYIFNFTLNLALEMSFFNNSWSSTLFWKFP